MTKKILLTASVIGVCFTSNAQITITKDDMPLANKEVIRHNASVTGTSSNFSLTGANYVWDFSDLVPTTADTISYDSINTAPFFAQAIFGALGGTQNRSHIFGDTKNPLNFPNLVASFFPVDSAKAYYRKANTSFAKTGFSLRLSGFDIPLPYDTADVMYKFPLTFGALDSSNSAFEINTAFLAGLYYRQSQKRVNAVDGWGKLTLPYSGTYEVLRVRSIVSGSDTIHVDTGFVNIGFRIPRIAETQYKWIAKGEDEPVLTVVGTEAGATFTPTSIKFKLGPAATALTTQVKQACYATKTENGATLHNATDCTSVEVYDMLGRKLTQAKNNGNSTVQLNYLPFNNVIIRCVNNNGKSTNLKLN
jgi:hypothetical protein